VLGVCELDFWVVFFLPGVSTCCTGALALPDADRGERTGVLGGRHASCTRPWPVATIGATKASSPFAAIRLAMESTLSLPPITPARCPPSWLPTLTVTGPRAGEGGGASG